MWKNQQLIQKLFFVRYNDITEEGAMNLLTYLKEMPKLVV